MSTSKESDVILEPKKNNQDFPSSSSSTCFQEKFQALKNSFTKFVIIKLSVVGVLIILMGFLSMHGLNLPITVNGDCIIDLGFKMTRSLNEFFISSVVFRRFLLITAGLLIDYIFFYVSIYWALFNKSWRLFITLALFYGVRGIFQSLYQMSYPDGFTWEYPGFPSVVVSYLKTNDFFYSGHVGMPMICYMEFKTEKKMMMAYFCLFIMLYEGFIVLISRVHYSIDIFVGMFFSQYIFIIVETWCNWYSDRFLKKKVSNAVIDSDIEKLEKMSQEQFNAGK